MLKANMLHGWKIQVSPICFQEKQVPESIVDFIFLVLVWLAMQILWSAGLDI